MEPKKFYKQFKMFMNFYFKFFRNQAAHIKGITTFYYIPILCLVTFAVTFPGCSRRDQHIIPTITPSETESVSNPKDYTKEYTLTEAGNFHKNDIVYFTKNREQVNIINSNDPNVDNCRIKRGFRLKILGFSQDEETALVEMLNQTSRRFLCSVGDKIILPIEVLSKTKPVLDYTLTEADNFHQNDIVYFTKHLEQVNKITGYDLTCYIKHEARLRILGFSQDKQIALVEMLDQTLRGRQCTAGDKIILPIEVLSKTKPYTLTEAGDFSKNDLVYFTKEHKWVDIINSNDSDRDRCFIKFESKFKVLGFSQDKQTALVEMLEEKTSRTQCTVGNQFILPTVHLEKLPWSKSGTFFGIELETLWDYIFNWSIVIGDDTDSR